MYIYILIAINCTFVRLITYLLWK